MQIILNAVNLIGDSIYSLRPIQKFIEQDPQAVVAIVADQGLAFELFQRTFFETGIPVVAAESIAKLRFPNAKVLKLSAGDVATDAYALMQEGLGHLHITEAYALKLGLILEPDLATLLPPTNWTQIEKDVVKMHIAISPFSRSCTRHSTGVPNKTLDDWKWEHILRYLRKQGYPIKMIGAKDDYMPLSVPMDDYFSASSLGELELFMKQTALLVSVDNGLVHFASMLGVPTIVLWPKVSDLTFIGPISANNTTNIVKMEPNSAQPAQLLHGIRKFARSILEASDEEAQTEEVTV